MIETVSNCGQGLNTDLTPEELGAGVWSDAENVRFSNGYAERFRGMAQLYATPAVVPYFVAPFAVNAIKYIIHMGLAAGYADDGTTRTDITGTAPTGAIDNRWTGGTLGGIFYVNNGVDNPMYWDGNTSNNLTTLVGAGGWNTNHKCKALRPFKNFLIALNITKTGTNYPHMVKWSAPAVPGAIPTSWDETNPALDAGEQDLAETPDVLVDGLPMGDVNIVYKERSMYAMSYIGAPYVFRFQRLPGNFGLLAAGCVVDTPVGHVVLSAGDVVLHTGGQPQSIANGAIRKYIFSGINPTYHKRAFVTSNPAKNEVWICFPYVGASTCNRAAVWNWVDKTWAIRVLSNVTYGCTGPASLDTAWSAMSGVTWATVTQQWSESEYSPAEHRLVLCHSTPLISLADSGLTDFGATIAASMTRTGMTLGDPMRVKTISGIRPRIDGSVGDTITIEAGGSMYPDAEPTWSAPVTYTIGQSIKADVFAAGRFLSVRFGNVGTPQWRMRSFDVDYMPGGLY